MYNSVEELCAAAEEKKQPMWREILENEMRCTEKSEEEIWEQLGGEGFLSVAEWPVYDEAKMADETVEIGVQVNGKPKDAVTIPVDCDEETAGAAAKQLPKIAALTEGKNIVKVIYKPGRILNLIVK